MVNRGRLIKSWGRSRNRAEQIAAVLGRRIDSGEFRRYADLPPVTELAEEFDVHRSTITSAKKLLGEYEFLNKVSGRWVVG
jgi:DNA-binding GntR family transcriptional regulator